MGNNKGHKRRFGSIRKTALGEFQASYLGPDGRRHFAPHRFKRERDADRWLNKTEDLIVSGDWTDPDRAKVKLADYAKRWVRERPGLRPRTVALYEWLLRKHVTPYIGEMELGKLSAATFRQLRADRLAAGASASVLAKCYRLLRGILNTAVDPDNIITKNPCKIPSAEKENPDERPLVTVAQVFQIAGKMPERFAPMVLLAAFGSLRYGEVVALRRCDVAKDGSWIRVSRSYGEVPGKGFVPGPPSRRAGVRTVILPEAIQGEIVAHLKKFGSRTRKPCCSRWLSRAIRCGGRTSRNARSGLRR